MELVVKETVAKLQYNRNTKNEKIIEHVRRIISEDYADNISLNDLADEVFISPNYLSSIFSKETGTTITDCITQTRISKAKELLINTNLKIYEIAAKVGYKNSKYFNTVFHKTTGLMPSQYRNNSI